MLRVLIAPDSFKGGASATAVALALAAGWLAVRPGDRVTRLPLADGGEGTLDVLAATVPGARRHRARVTGPGGAPVTGRWLGLPGGTGVAELARSSGLPLLARPDPMGAQTTGLGEVLGRVLDAGADRILVGLGGSAATDGGTGALAALGARFLDAAGRPLPPGGGAPTARGRPGWKRGWPGSPSCSAVTPPPRAPAPPGAPATASPPPGARSSPRERQNCPAWLAWTARWPTPIWLSPGKAGS